MKRLVQVMKSDDDVLTYENIIDQFLKEFPEFKQKAEDEKEWWYPEHDEDENDEPLVVIFFANVLNQFLVEALRTLDDPELLIRIFNFFERMALSPDELIPGILQAETLEYLGDDKLILERARKFMGAQTLKLSHEIEKNWGRE
jgi:hypothetical protein